MTRAANNSAARGYAQPDVMNTISLKGKTYVVTGANQGVGYEVAKYLASRSGKVVMVCRNPGRAEAARAKIVAETEVEVVSALSLPILPEHTLSPTSLACTFVNSPLRRAGRLSHHLRCRGGGGRSPAVGRVRRPQPETGWAGMQRRGAAQ